MQTYNQLRYYEMIKYCNTNNAHINTVKAQAQEISIYQTHLSNAL